MVGPPSSGSSSPNRVGDVLFARPDVEVLGVHAGAVVAPMADFFAVGDGLALEDQNRSDMRTENAAVMYQATVPLASTALPVPAAGVLVYNARNAELLGGRQTAGERPQRPTAPDLLVVGEAQPFGEIIARAVRPGTVSHTAQGYRPTAD